MDEKNQKRFVRWVNGIWYSITLAPDDNLQFRRTGTSRFDHFEMWWQKNRCIWDTGVEDIILYPDLSFPEYLGSGKFPRIHYHGIIKFCDVNAFLLTNSLDTYFRVEIDTISDHDEWIRYCEKYLKYVEKASVTSKVIRYQSEENCPLQNTGNGQILQYFETVDALSASDSEDLA